MTRAEFLVKFPEFESAPSALIDSALSDASAIVPTTWGDWREQVIGLETAQALATSPMGRNARLVEDATIYEAKLLRLKRAQACLLNRV